MHTLNPGRYEWIRWQDDHMRGIEEVQLIGRMGMEPSHYRCRRRTGQIVIVNDSMLRPVAHTTPDIR